MANPFRDMSVIMQALVAAAVAVVLVLVGVYVPGSPIARERDEVDRAVQQRTKLHFAVRYETQGMWMFHCHILEHAERGMMGDLMVMP